MRQVDDPRHGPGDDHAGCVPDDADGLAQRLEQADRLGEGLRGGVLGGGEGDPGRPAVVERQVEVDDVAELDRRLAVGKDQLAAAGQHQAGPVVLLVLADLDARLADQREQFGGRTQITLGDDVRGCLRLLRGVRLRTLGVGPVVVPAVPRLAAEPAGLDEPPLGERGREAHVLEEGLPHGVRHGLVDVLADQVGQLEGPHPEAAALAQDGVDRRGVGGLRLVHREGLGVEGPGDAVDDEAGGVGAGDRRLAPGACRLVRARGRREVARVPGDDLHQRQQRRRVEEVQSDQSAGVAQGAADGRDGQRRGVGGEQTVVLDDVLELAEQLLFRLELFEHRLDDERAVRQLGEAVRGVQPGACRVPVGGGEPVLLDEPVEARADRFGRRVGTPGNRVVEPHGVARDERDLGDALAHGAGADDGHGAAEVECCHVRDPPARGFPQMRRSPLSRPIVRLL